jgi:hypothetical protein
MAIKIPASTNLIINRFRDYTDDRPDSWEDYPIALIDDMRHALAAHAGEDVYVQGEDIGVDELYGALTELFDEVGVQAYNAYAAGARDYFDNLRATVRATPTPAAPRVRHDFITVFEVGRQMPTHVHRFTITRFTPVESDADNSTYISLTTGGILHVYETSEEIFAMLGAGS